MNENTVTVEVLGPIKPLPRDKMDRISRAIISERIGATYIGPVQDVSMGLSAGPQDINEDGNYLRPAPDTP